METAVQFLCARYPHYFSLSPDKSILRNGILDSETNISATHPLHVLLDNVPEDFAIMLRDERSGRYVLRAGVICSALGWNLGTKLGKHLADIHAPIPDYKEKMAFSMDRYVSSSSLFHVPQPFSTPKKKGVRAKKRKSQCEVGNRLEGKKIFADRREKDTLAKNQPTNPSNAAPGASK